MPWVQCCILPGLPWVPLMPPSQEKRDTDRSYNTGHKHRTRVLSFSRHPNLHFPTFFPLTQGSSDLSYWRLFHTYGVDCISSVEKSPAREIYEHSHIQRIGERSEERAVWLKDIFNLRKSLKPKTILFFGLLKPSIVSNKKEGNH
jgi:hypothetical protein